MKQVVRCLIGLHSFARIEHARPDDYVHCRCGVSITRLCRGHQ